MIVPSSLMHSPPLVMLFDYIFAKSATTVSSSFTRNNSAGFGKVAPFNWLTQLHRQSSGTQSIRCNGTFLAETSNQKSSTHTTQEKEKSERKEDNRKDNSRRTEGRETRSEEAGAHALTKSRHGSGLCLSRVELGRRFTLVHFSSTRSRRGRQWRMVGQRGPITHGHRASICSLGRITLPPSSDHYHRSLLPPIFTTTIFRLLTDRIIVPFNKGTWIRHSLEALISVAVVSASNTHCRN